MNSSGWKVQDFLRLRHGGEELSDTFAAVPFAGERDS
jgi:hypothetical protein